jgi:hypothetical protein
MIKDCRRIKVFRVQGSGFRVSLRPYSIVDRQSSIAVIDEQQSAEIDE